MNGYRSNNGRYVFVRTEQTEYPFDADGEPLYHSEEEIPSRVLEEARAVAEYGS